MFKFFSRIFSKLFPSKYEKDVKTIKPLVEEINSNYEEYQKLTDDELKQKTTGFKETIQNNTKEYEEKIVELQEKLKGDLTHQERIDI